MINKLIRSFLYTTLIAQSLSADVYFEPTQTTYNQAVYLLDWDKVIADDTTPFSKFFAAVSIIPASKSFPMAFRQCGRIIESLCKAGGDRQSLKGTGTNIDYMICREPALKKYRSSLMDKLNEAWPRLDMIAHVQNMQASGAKLVAATNNDIESLLIKLNKLNKRLTQKNLKPLKLDGYFCAGSSSQVNVVDGKAPDDIPTKVVFGGKDTDEYFVKLFAFAEKQYGYDRSNTLFVFIDDLEKNITRARAVAKKENIALCAVHRNKPDKIIAAEMQQALSKYLPSSSVAS